MPGALNSSLSVSSLWSAILLLAFLGGLILIASGLLQRRARRRPPTMVSSDSSLLPTETIGRVVERVSRLASGAIVLASLALLGSAVLVGLRVADGHDDTEVSPSGGPSLPTITVIGRGSAPLLPDTAVVVIGLQGTWPTLAEVTERVDIAVESAWSAGADPVEERIVAYRVTSIPVVATGNALAEPQSVQVDYRIALTVRDLARLDAVLAAASQAGASVLGVGIGVADIPAVMATARAQALSDARSRAEQLATALGVTVLHADVTEELSTSLPPSPLALAVADPGFPSLSPSMEVTVEVVVKFAVR